MNDWNTHLMSVKPTGGGHGSESKRSIGDGSVAASSSPSTASSPCAACKFLRRKCQPDCVFAPYFPPDQPQKFVQVHRVFGASNVTKLLNEVNPYQREDAVNSLAYEADMRLRDPVYGCAGVISVLQHQLRQLQLDLAFAMSELSKCQSAAAAAVGHRSRMSTSRSGRRVHLKVLKRSDRFISFC
ncbi:hypothetical protein C4D60_Mb07t03840 [Musa balbisiana]|uniref:LOB domain-containing protein n=1 Tax=Musa balbisiana TaxID=52838 RepID=A0A4S8JEM1_MUSBA|nr:hypothetical protein C4D60_Mb07t03840 [Musa balbisiana]